MAKKILKFNKFINERYYNDIENDEFDSELEDTTLIDPSDDDIIGELSPEEFDAKMAELSREDIEDTIEYETDILTADDIDRSYNTERETTVKPTIAPPITKPSRPRKPSPIRRDRPSVDPKPKARLKKATVRDLVKKTINLDNEE